MAELLEAALIHIDVNHHGDVEDALLQYLAGNGYRGCVVLDDIFLNEDMDRVWGSQGTDPPFLSCSPRLAESVVRLGSLA
jgi:hypothetical protein